MHGLTYSIEGLMATMIAELACVIRYKDEPNADLVWPPVRFLIMT